MKPTIKAALALAFAVFNLSGCLIVSDNNHGEGCYDDCRDYEVCETYCDSWECWDECWWETTCDTYCDETTVDVNIDVTTTVDCFNDFDCGEGQICVADVCKPRDTEDNGLAGLCQTCSNNADCVEDTALCIQLNFDQATSTGEKVCTRTCEYNHDCPSGFECINVSSEVGVPAQCLPVKGEFEKRTCNPSPELECVRATDCAVGESCVNNDCKGPNDAQCDSNNPCASGQTCRNFACVAVDAPECTTRTDCRSGEICIDGSCEAAAAEGCVFNAECDGGMCVDGTCLSTCASNAECGTGENCRAGLCEPAECRRTADCGGGEICVDASCENTCNKTTGAGCTTGYSCNTLGYCEPDTNVACRTNAECGRDEICTAGDCVTPCTCNQDCGSGQVCDLNSGSCKAPPATPITSCQTTCDCPGGQTCTDGQCG
jgi:hypothetical protein